MEFQSKIELSRFLTEDGAARGYQDSPCGRESITANICIHMNDKYGFEQMLRPPCFPNLAPLISFCSDLLQAAGGEAG
jgi:hypothetical protein